MSVEAVAAAHYQAQRAITAAVVTGARREWAKVDVANLDETFSQVAHRLQVIMVAGQTAAASQADPYVQRVTAQQGVHGPAEGAVQPRAFAGQAADGRGLASLLYEPVIAAKAAAGAGASYAQVSATGLSSLLRIFGSEIPDAGRGAVGASIVSHRHLTGYVRMLTPPSCSRCAILAGRWYRYNAGFQRHPRCDCQAVPAAENVSGDLRTDPELALSRGQVTDLSATDRRAIEDGADFGKVVNAHRAGYSPETVVEKIYRLAPDRETAIVGLRNAGFIT